MTVADLTLSSTLHGLNQRNTSPLPWRECQMTCIRLIKTFATKRQVESSECDPPCCFLPRYRSCTLGFIWTSSPFHLRVHLGFFRQPSDMHIRVLWCVVVSDVRGRLISSLVINIWSKHVYLVLHFGSMDMISSCYISIFCHCVHLWQTL